MGVGLGILRLRKGAEIMPVGFKSPLARLLLWVKTESNLGLDTIMTSITTRTILLVGISGSLVGSAIGADWPGWRGADRTDISRESGLLKEWPSAGPKQLWIYREAGKGYSGPAVVKGVLYTLGTRGNQEVLIAVDAKTGKEMWKADVGEILANNWGDGPRGTPAVDDGKVYALGGKGDLICVSAKDGSQVWKKSMTALGGGVPGWGYTESVLVDGDRVIATPGGSQGAIVAFDKKTGATLWQTKDFTDGAQYSSVIATDLNGERQYIQLTMKTIVGVSAKDGKVLWKAEWPGRTAVIPTPIYSDGHVYVSSGYGVGCKLVKIASNNEVSTVYENKVMKNHHGGVILVGDHLYGYSDGPGWVCQNFKTGEEVWSSKNLGKGAIACADGLLYCVEEDTGTVALIEPTTKGWTEKGRFKLDPQSTIRSKSGRIWTHPVISDGQLFLRDQDLVYCYDVKR